ncbi:MAG: lipopolysaccharide heptosyltransferase II [Planctomycetota bacterium]
MKNSNILVWLPSPIGDSILCTPALRAIREYFHNSRVCFYANDAVHRVLTGSGLNDTWIRQTSRNPLHIAILLRRYEFNTAILFKNSFGSAFAVYLAGIPSRIGYAREGRAVMLTKKICPPTMADGSYKPLSAVDYYLGLAELLGCDILRKNLQLKVEPDDASRLKMKLGTQITGSAPVVVMVPGGAFGPSKCWPSERFAETADRLIEKYNAKVFVSTAPNRAEEQIARQICAAAKHNIIDLRAANISLGELKSLISIASLVICNDTGPRHMAIALGRSVVTLFGPNNPAWTETNYDREIKIRVDVDCSPCDKPRCTANEHYCMEGITVDMVFQAAQKLLENKVEDAR